MVLITLGRPRRDQEIRLCQRGKECRAQAKYTYTSLTLRFRRLGPNHAFSGGTRTAPPLTHAIRSAFWRVVEESLVVPVMLQ